MRIGNLELCSPVVLAPMAGYTDAAMRSLCQACGAGLTYTEVTNAAGLIRDSGPTWHLLSTRPEEGPVAAHLYGSDPAVMAEAAHRIDALKRFAVIDINAGCPVRKIVAKGAGAALMRSPQLIHDIIAAVRAAVTVPVTLKTRIGLTPETVNILEVAAAAEQAGAAAIAVHARVASQQHRGAADWDLLGMVASALRIPVIGNGGIRCAADVPRMLEATGVAGVMIGRAAVGRPWLFEDAARLLRGEVPIERSTADIRSAAREQLARLLELKQCEQVLRRRSALSANQATALHFRAHLVQYLRGLGHWSDIRRQLNTLDDCEETMRIIDRVLARQPHDRLRQEGGDQEVSDQ